MGGGRIGIDKTIVYGEEGKEPKGDGRIHSTPTLGMRVSKCDTRACEL